MIPVPERAKRDEGPERTCVGCRRTAPCAELSRFVLVDGVIVADPQRRLPGRGAWLHEDPACRELADRRGAFSRALRTRANRVGNER